MRSVISEHLDVRGRAARPAAGASFKESLEPGHPTIATGQSNLATVLRDLGQLEEARDLLQKALASDEKSFEPGHPSIARRQSNLALVLKDLGQMEEARDLLRKAYSSSLERFGADHPSTKTIKRNLDSLPAATSKVVDRNHSEKSSGLVDPTVCHATLK